MPACLPREQAVHAASFDDGEYVPRTHKAQARSTLALGADVTCLPAAHVVCTRHALCPSASWNEPSGHCLHAVASSAAAKRPAAQFSHTRSALAVAAAVSCVPLRQRCTLRHTVCPDDDWYCPLAHPSHDVLALAFCTCPAAHSWQ